MNAHQTTSIGRQGEDAAADYLLKNGYVVLYRNFRVRGGEIDIIAQRGNELIFVEVKARSSHSYGFPEQSVTARKTAFISRAIREFIRKHRGAQSFYIRFDIIAAERRQGESDWHLRHIENSELPYAVS